MTDFNECVTVYGTDVITELPSKGPRTKLHFHINSEESVVDLVDQVMRREGQIINQDDEIVLNALELPVKKLFFELFVTCKEARKWGCPENFIVQK